MSIAKRGRDKFFKYKRYIIFLAQLYGLLPLRIRKKFFEFHMMTKGLVGILLRYALLKSIAVQCGDNVLIQPGVYILQPENITIFDNVSIHPMGYIDATGGISIGSDVSIAHGATIMSTTHKYEDASIPIKDQGIELMQTIIKDNVWIGAKATILAGIIIESGSVVAANSVVTKNVSRNAIVGGMPAQTIKFRQE